MKSMRVAGSYPKPSKAGSQAKRLEDELSPADLEICQILHSLWWKTRQRNLARLQAAVLSNKEIPA